MSQSVPCPCCAKALYLPYLDMMSGGKETVICRECHVKYHLVCGEVTHFEQEVIQAGKPGSASKTTIELRRYHLRVMRPGQTMPELYEFDRSPEADIFRVVKGDLVLLVFSGEDDQLLQVHNLSTALKLTIKAPQSEALLSAQILAGFLGVVCTGYLWMNKVTTFQVALIGSTVVSVGFGYGAYKRLQPKEKDLDVRLRLGAVQEHLQIQRQVEQELATVRKTQEADQAQIDKLHALKGYMASDPDRAHLRFVGGFRLRQMHKRKEGIKALIDPIKSEMK